MWKPSALRLKFKPMTVNEFLRNVEQFPGYDGRVVINDQEGVAHKITIYWRLFSRPPQNIVWLMADNLGPMAWVEVVFRINRWEVIRWRGGTYISFC